MRSSCFFQWCSSLLFLLAYCSDYVHPFRVPTYIPYLVYKLSQNIPRGRSIMPLSTSNTEQLHQSRGPTHSVTRNLRQYVASRPPFRLAAHMYRALFHTLMPQHTPSLRTTMYCQSTTLISILSIQFARKCLPRQPTLLRPAPCAAPRTSCTSSFPFSEPPTGRPARTSHTAVARA
jgi:hypothetical protein